MATARFLTGSAQLAAHERSLAKTLGLRRTEPRALDAVLMDTFDGRLVRAGGIVLRHDISDDRCELQWTSLGRDEDRGSVQVPRTEAVDRAVLPPGPVTARLEELLDVRALLPLARVRGAVRRWEKRDRRGKIVLRVHVEPALTIQPTGARRAVDLPAQIHVVGLRGFEKVFDEACRAARRLDHVTEADTPWTVDALRAIGARPGHDPSAIDVALRADASPRQGVRRLAAAYLQVIVANREGTRRALDPEFLHDFRVATRRMRSLLKASRGVWPEALGKRFRAEFRWLARQTSRARDLDVYVLDFEDLRARVPRDEREALDPVRAWLETERSREHARLSDTLDGERAERLLDDFRSLLASRAFADAPSHDDRDLGALAIETIEAAHRRLLRDGRRIHDSSPDQALHDLRKRAKELRYLLDGFGSLFGRRSVRKQVKALKRLQDNLGTHQDRVVQAETLRRVANELEGAPASTLVALGTLIERLREDGTRLRHEFAARFAAYDAADRRAAFARMLAGKRGRAAEASG